MFDLIKKQTNTQNSRGFPGGPVVRIGGHGNPLQYSCLESPMGRGAWQTAVHGVPKNQTRLSTGHADGC